MTWQRIAYISVLCVVAWIGELGLAVASEYHGQITFGGLPVPGASVTATQGTKKLTAITDQHGIYVFPELADGGWTIEVEKLCFSTVRQDIVIARNTSAAEFELKLLPVDKISGLVEKAPTTSAVTLSNNLQPNKQDSKLSEPQSVEIPKLQDADNERASDGLLINGSVNNAASSPFSIAPAFGNTRGNHSGLYNGGVGVILDNSALDARPFSLSGLNTPKESSNQVTGVVTLGGPITIPHLLPRGPNFFAGYQWMRSQIASILPGLVPDAAERSGDFSNVLNAAGEPIEIFNPATGLPFAGNFGPISTQAQALLNLYPLPNLAGNSAYNYQIPTVGNTHKDAQQSRLDKTIGTRDQLYGGFAFQSSRSNASSLFGFLDTTDVLGINTRANWSHRFNQRFLMNAGYQFSRLRTEIAPFFEDRSNVSGAAGIFGNDQDPTDWGPPGLTFSSGIAPLSDAQSAFNRSETNGSSFSLSWNHLRHYVTVGEDFRRQEFNYLSQQNPRGTFTFTGAATQGIVDGVAVGGSDFADFLLGIPDTSSIAYGNADKYFRESVYDVYGTDDWRISPELTVNAGGRWEYGAPITELFGRLVNLDITSGFAAAAPVVASDPIGPLTGQRYPDSLIRPDKHVIEPRIGISWRPISGSPIVVRVGYGVYSDTSIYEATALLMAQQEPLSKSVSVQSSAVCPESLASGFNPCSSIASDTFGVDPRFRVGYAQNWQMSVQSDLPASFQLTATYLGIKGTRGVQEFLPNTYPTDAINPCPICPTGFVYRTSNGNSTREAGQVQLRRRLREGFTASLEYAYSKSIDDDSMVGGQGPVAPGLPEQGPSQAAPTIAQNWLDLNAERGLSTFDQRHLLNAELQYTTGMGIGGGALMNGWKGTIFKDWTILSTITAGSGLPETPVFLVAVTGTGVTGSIRPDTTGKPIYSAPAGLFLNPEAYTAPVSARWGDAGRDSITGPGEFSLNASMARTFRLEGRFNLDLRVDSTNLLNHTVFSAWNTTVGSPQFGLPVAANPMRSLQTTLRLRF
jgi:trimeric autotransporter adhesin